jgi:hypothetical protein
MFQYGQDVKRKVFYYGAADAAGAAAGAGRRIKRGIISGGTSKHMALGGTMSH